MTEEIVELIIAKLDGNASTEQEGALNYWLNTSADNQEEYRRIKTLWSKSSSIKHLGLVNKNRDWQSVKTQIGFGRRSKILKWGAAASIVLLIGVATTLQYFNAQPSVYSSDDQILTITLADGSEVVLNKQSSLSVSKEFGEVTRSVALTGEAFFEITKDPAHPFHIEARNTHTQVLGTAFNIDADGNETAIQVAHGLVKFSTRKSDIKLTENMGARARVDGTISASPSNPNAFAWRTGILTFLDQPLAQVIDVIAKHYDLDIIVDADADLSITSTFDNQSVQEVLEEICLIHELTLSETATGFDIQQ